MNKKKILILGFIAIVCFGITLSSDSRKLEGRLDFCTGTMALNEGDNYFILPSGEENHKRLTESINADLYASIKKFFSQNRSTSFPDFNLKLQHQNGIHSAIIYNVYGEDAIEDLTDFLLKDAIETRFRLLANKEFLEVNEGNEYRGGYSKELNKTWLSHFSGYIGMIAIFWIICHALSYKQKDDPDKFELSKDDLKTILKKSD